jgi:hypothetical protein
VRLAPLYRMTFTYPEAWSVGPMTSSDTEAKQLLLADGRCDGRLSGRLRAANHPRRRADGTYCPDFHGVIETDDGAIVLLDLGGYGRAYPVEARQVVGWVTHTTDHDTYRWLNDSVCAVAGEVRATPDGPLLVLDVHELIWEPLAD